MQSKYDRLSCNRTAFVKNQLKMRWLIAGCDSAFLTAVLREKVHLNTKLNDVQRRSIQTLVPTSISIKNGSVAEPQYCDLVITAAESDTFN